MGTSFSRRAKELEEHVRGDQKNTFDKTFIASEELVNDSFRNTLWRKGHCTSSRLNARHRYNMHLASCCCFSSDPPLAAPSEKTHCVTAPLLPPPQLLSTLHLGWFLPALSTHNTTIIIKTHIASCLNNRTTCTLK